MSTPLLPKGIDFVRWANQLTQDVPQIDIPIIKDIKGWREWAAQIVTNNALYNVPVPTKLAYPSDEDWKKWAAFFVDSVYN